MSQEDLEIAVTAILRAHPRGITEFALFAELAKRGFEAFARDVFSDTLRMFRSHFVLFHVLHSMRDRLALRREGHLHIEATRIQLIGGQGGPQAGAGADAESEEPDALAEHDRLHEYYLDLGHLESTTDADLDAMLGTFWQRFHARDDQREALRVFGLDDGATWEVIKTRHRTLVFEHHPDRGGDASRLAQINAAMRILQTLRAP